MTIGREKPTYIISKSKQIYIWHHWLGYGNNARVFRASKLVNSINIGNVEYNSEEVFIDSDLSKINEPPNIVNKNTAHRVNLPFSSSSLEDTTLSDFNQLCNLILEVSPPELFYKKIWHQPLTN